MKRKAVALLIAVIMLAPACIPASAEFDTSNREGVAMISVCFEFTGKEPVLISWGTGFFVGEDGKDPSHMITNYHVIDTYVQLGSGDLMTMDLEDGTQLTGRSKLRIYYGSDSYDEAYPVEYNSQKDVAVLKLSSPTDKRKSLPLLPPTDEMAGSTVYAVGYPGLAENVFMESTSSWGTSDASVTQGVFSRLSTITGTGMEQISMDCDIKHGNSGGPLFNEAGAVIGINYSGISNADGEQVNYAISVSEAITLLERNNVPYTLYTPKASGLPIAFVIVPLALLAVIAIALAIVLLAKRKRLSEAPARAIAPPPGPAAPAGELRLQCLSGTFAGRRFSVNGTVRLGRDPARNDLVFPNNVQGISGAHCSVTAEGGSLMLTDLGSTYGTFIGGRRLTPNQPVRLQAGDKFYLGSEEQMFQAAVKGGM